MCVEDRAKVCEICKEGFIHSIRHPNQKICFKKACKKANKAQWQKDKMKNDPDYNETQKLANKIWRNNNPDYLNAYRNNNPQSVLRNQLTQKIRNLNRKNRVNNKAKQRGSDDQQHHLSIKTSKMIAKMDLVNPSPVKDGTQFWLVPVIAKMDPVKVCFFLNTRHYKPPSPFF